MDVDHKVLDLESLMFIIDTIAGWTGGWLGGWLDGWVDGRLCGYI